MDSISSASLAATATASTLPKSPLPEVRNNPWALFAVLPVFAILVCYAIWWFKDYTETVARGGYQNLRPLDSYNAFLRENKAYRAKQQRSEELKRARKEHAKGVGEPLCAETQRPAEMGELSSNTGSKKDSASVDPTTSGPISKETLEGQAEGDNS